MKTILLSIALAFALVAPARAQAQQTPSQIAIQLDGVINSWAQTIESQNKVIADLQKEVADLKAKYEPPAQK